MCTCIVCDMWGVYDVMYEYRVRVVYGICVWCVFCVCCVCVTWCVYDVVYFWYVKYVVNVFLLCLCGVCDRYSLCACVRCVYDVM